MGELQEERDWAVTVSDCLDTHSLVGWVGANHVLRMQIGLFSKDIVVRNIEDKGAEIKQLEVI